MQSTEIWKPVVGYEGMYEVSDRGRVRSVDREVNAGHGKRMIPGVILKPAVKDTGRLQVGLSRRRFKLRRCVHQLVAEAFLGPKPEGMQVCHNDGNHLNNVVENLRWGTQSENMLDRARHGTDHNRNKTHCPQGHEYSPENTYVNSKGWRKCRACTRAWSKNANRSKGRSGLPVPGGEES